MWFKAGNVVCAFSYKLTWVFLTVQVNIHRCFMKISFSSLKPCSHLKAAGHMLINLRLTGEVCTLTNRSSMCVFMRFIWLTRDLLRHKTHVATAACFLLGENPTSTLCHGWWISMRHTERNLC